MKFLTTFSSILKKISSIVFGFIWMMIIIGAFLNEEKQLINFLLPSYALILGIGTAYLAKQKKLNGNIFAWFIYGAIVPIISWFDVLIAGTEKTSKNKINAAVVCILFIIIFLSFFSIEDKKNDEENSKLHLRETHSKIKTTEIAFSKEETSLPKTKELSENARKQRRWFLDNFEPGMKWNHRNIVKRFGAYEKYNPEVGNPKILQMFYFEEVDMTLMVNILEGTVVTWRFGKAYK